MDFILLAVFYIGFLFALAGWGDSGSARAKRVTSHPAIYALALGIYCTAWTFYGGVGEASRNNWSYLPILLGPMLVYLFGYPLLHKMVLVSKKQHITSIADFIASRYGKRQNVALIVTLLALMAAIPYIALQLKAIGAAFLAFSSQGEGVLVVALATAMIALFTILFGVKHTDITQSRHGLMVAVAFESSIKLLALIAVVVVGWVVLQNDKSSHFSLAPFANFDWLGSGSFWAHTIMAGAAVICLPRQFHISVVDNLKLEHLHTARWLFPLYLGLTALLIPVIAGLGDGLLVGNNADRDTYVLDIANMADLSLVKGFIFIGGLSAATAMIIVSALAMSTMFSNDVILPRLLANQEKQTDTRRILLLRRITIVGLLGLAFFYYLQMTRQSSLFAIGLLAFSLVIQLLPAIVGGLYWRRGHALGVYAGLTVGISVWLLTMMLPLFQGGDRISYQSQAITEAAMLSLLANTLSYVVFSLLAKPKLIDKIQAQAFVQPKEMVAEHFNTKPHPDRYDDLVTLLNSFLGESRTRQLTQDFNRKLEANSGTQADDFISFCERALGGVLGSASAKALLDSVLRGQKLDFEQVASVFDDTTQAIQFNINALMISLESIEQGISVVDKDLKLVAWNKRYVELLKYPDDMVSVGMPVEQLIRYNAQRGECGVGEIEELVQKRLRYLRDGSAHRFVRQRSDGRVIEMIGNPLPNGGFATSFSDITALMETQQALREANVDLENRVRSRTDQVHAINAELHQEIERRAAVEQALILARQAAEQANASKTQFLAQASHDVLQPLNAAKLYLNALKDASVDTEFNATLEKLDYSLQASETLIGTLLEIARLDQGDFKPQLQSIGLAELLQPLVTEQRMQAERKGLRLRVHLPDDLWVYSDRTYLLRITQNLLSNAIKYTLAGGVLLSVRKRGDKVLLQVWDTGVGIDASQQEKVFDDFYRAHDSIESGLGLGLSVVARLAKLLDIPLTLRSEPGKGSCFSLLLSPGVATHSCKAPPVVMAGQLNGLRCLVVDDQSVNLDAMQTLLKRWQVSVELAQTSQQAQHLMAQHTFDALLIDYDLLGDCNGLELIASLQKLAERHIPAALVTASKEESLIKQCRAEQIGYIGKPVKPAKLRAWLTAVSRQ